MHPENNRLLKPLNACGETAWLALYGVTGVWRRGYHRAAGVFSLNNVIRYSVSAGVKRLRGVKYLCNSKRHMWRQPGGAAMEMLA